MVTETVNAAFNGYGSSLALNSAGRPYIGYINPLGGAEITYKDVDSWQVIVPFPSRSAIRQPLADSGFPSLALNSMDRIHLVYLDYSTTCRLRYVFQTAQGWRTEVIDQDPLGCAGVQPTLALDYEGNPQVAYHTEYEKTSHLKFAFKDPGLAPADPSRSTPASTTTRWRSDPGGKPGSPTWIGLTTM